TPGPAQALRTRRGTGPRGRRRPVARSRRPGTMGLPLAATRSAPGCRRARAPEPLVENHPAGDGDVQAADRAGHRYAYQQVATIAGQATQALAFGAEDPGDRIGQI